jgi:hypothetical protein
MDLRNEFEPTQPIGIIMAIRFITIQHKYAKVEINAVLLQVVAVD